VIKATDCLQGAVWVIDPEGVYIEKTRDDPDFRVLKRGQWKRHSLLSLKTTKHLKMDVRCTGVQEIAEIYCTTRVTHKEKTFIVKNGVIGRLQQGDGSAMMWGCNSENFSQSGNLDDEPLSQRRNHTSTRNNEYPVMVLNETKLDGIEQARLWHWRTAHSGGDVPMKMGTFQIRLNEDCYCYDQAKYKHKSYKRNRIDAYAKNDPWWHVFCDGYGGQLSMGTESYE